MTKHTKSIAPKGLSRRAVLQGSAALGVASVIGGTLGLAKNARAQSANAHYELTIDFLDDARVYNGKSLGPTMRIRPGDTLDVDLINNLPALHDDCTDNHNRAHGLNTTNFHTHGLHVSPSTDSTGEFDADNVFVNLVPEGQIVACEEVCGVDVKTMFRYGSNRFRFELPEDHITGTFWYHAHKHGSTAVQVGDGLAGPLIVEDEPGVMPDYIEQAVERIFFITNRGMMLVDEDGGGDMNPEITMRPGEVQRWRVINGTGNGTDYAFMRPNIANLEMHLIAFDGVTQDRRIPVDYDFFDTPWFNPSALASGNRADYIVRAPSIAEPRDTLGSTNLSRVVDMQVLIEGSPVEAPWSDEDTLPGAGLVPFDDTELPKRAIDFTRNRTIDREAFDGELKQTMTLGTAEDWTVGNNTQVLHVYHIHVNPFFITHINGEALPEGSPLARWQDTIGVPLGGDVGFKTRFESFTGTFVIHCHVLPHEDQGMMQIVEVVEA